MIVVVPVALGVPAVFVLVPPAMILIPAALAGFVKFVALVVGLGAVASMSLDGFVELVVGVRDSALAVVVGLGMQAWGRGEK